MATPGYGRSQAAKTTASYKAAVKAEQEQIKLIDVDKSAESVIIKTRQLAQKKKFNYRDFDEVIDVKSVDDLKAFTA